MTEQVRTIRVLCVDDNAMDRALIRDALEREAADFVLLEAADRAAFEDALASEEFDLVITDFNILGFEGLDVIRRIQEQRPEVPVIVVTGTGSEEVAVRSLKSGASDYVIKTPRHIAQLPYTIRRVLDATETRRRLKQHVDNLRAVLEQNADGILVLDPANRVLYANPEAERLLGIPVEELLDQELPLPADEPSEQGRIPLPQRSGGPGMGDVRRSKTVWNGHPCMMVIIRDVTDQTKAEKALLKTEQSLHAVMESVQDAVVITDQSGTVTYWNRAATQIFGYTKEEALGRSIVDLIIPDADRTSHMQAIARFARTGRGPHLGRITERTARHKDRHLVPVEMSLARFRLEDEWHAVAVVRDITQRREIEDGLRRTQKLQAVGRLASGVAHEFNNTLSIIIGFAQLLLGELDPSDPRHELADQILQAGRRSADLVAQLLTFSRKQVTKPEPLDLSAAVAARKAMIRHLLHVDVDLELDLAADLPGVEMDPGQFDQALLNLAINAKDALPEQGGRVVVETSHRSVTPHEAEAKGLKPGEYVVLRITDNGCGMDAETKARIFEPFFTTKPLGKGTGLGLSVVYGIVSHLGGTISVQTQPGAGTTFELFFPAMSETKPEEPRDRSSSSRGAARTVRVAKTVLVVEDEESLRKLTARILKGEGFEVACAADGVEALSLVDENSLAPDLVVLDVVMPKLGGKELAERLRRRNPTMAVIFMSGHAEPDILGPELRKDRTQFLQKPFTPQELTALVQSLLEQ